ncbi:MAG: SPFH domain-containing protein [Chloroflexota bacterium]|nr:SPFH domain-containing protein [Chloroflexota bacterium]
MRDRLPPGFPAREDIRVPRGYRIGAIAIAAVIVLFLFSAFLVQVDATEACAVTRFGKVTGTAGPGLHLRIPGVTQYRCFRTATTYYEVLESGADQTDADYTSGPVDGVTIDGQQLSLTFNVRYRVDAAEVSHIYADIAKTPGEINERVVKFHTRSISRQIANTKRADELYLGNLAPISVEMRDAIAPRFTEAGLILEFFELKRPNFSDPYEQAIESRQIATILIDQRRQEVLVAEQEAERLRNQAQGEADATFIRAQGEALSLAEQGRAVRENPEILDLERIRALTSANVIYVPSEGVLPVLDLGAARGTSAPAPTSAPLPDPAAAPTPTPTS